MKRRIRLSERDLHRVIRESVKRVLMEERFKGEIGKYKPFSNSEETEDDVYLGKHEGHPYREYVTKDGKLHTHYTPMVQHGFSREWGTDNEPIDYDGRYDDDLTFHKFMGTYDDARSKMINQIIDAIGNRTTLNDEDKRGLLNAFSTLSDDALYTLYDSNVGGGN